MNDRSARKPTINIRPANLADLSKVEALDSLACETLSYPRFVLRQLYDCFPNLFLVAEADERVVGYVLGGLKQGSDIGYCLSLATHPTYLRLGIGVLLMNDLRKVLKTTGTRRLQLTVFPGNEAAIKLYSGLGFKPIKNYDDYYGDSSPRILMEKTI
jgi:ribosomal-protein-alanine N-acetyltransferase